MSDVHVFGPFRFNAATGRLRRGADEVALPPRAQTLLGYLLERPDRLVTKDQLLDAVWPGVHVSDTSLKEAVHVLRQALDDDPRSPVYVETVPRRGYRFLAPVKRQAPRRETAAAASPAWGRVPRWRLTWWVAGIGLGLTLAAFLVAHRRPPGPGTPSVPHRFEIRLPAEHVLTPGPPNLALSPDGRHLVYVAKSRGARRLFLRPVGRLDAVALAGTEGASSPFFSPDGRWIGFFTEAALKRVATAGGPAETLCDVGRGLAASWGRRGIVMSLLDARDRTGLWQVPAAGGRPRVLTTRREGEAAHRWPEVLPAGDAVVFTVWRSSAPSGGIGGKSTGGGAETVMLDLESGERSVLLEGAQARYAPPGHLVLVRRGRLWAVPFDARRRRLEGEAVPVLDGVATTPVFGTAHFAVAATGSLVYMPRIEAPPPVLRRLRGGHGAGRQELALAGTVSDLRLSPDGRRLAIAAAGDGGLDLWVFDLERGALARRTFDGANFAPVWSPDGRWLLSASMRGGVAGLFRLAADGGGEDERLWTDDVPAAATSWSSDGRHVAFSRLDPENGWDLWILDLGEESGEAVAEPWLSGPHDEVRGTFSPDGRFLAYESDETGRREIYVRPFPGSEAKWTISTDGGSHPLWSSDGRQIWFRRGEQVYAVDLELGPVVEIGRPEPRLEAAGVPGYNVAVAGGEVLYLDCREDLSASAALTFVVNWLGDFY